MNLDRVRAQARLGASALQSLGSRRLVVNAASAILVGSLLYFALRGARLDVTWRLLTGLQTWPVFAIFAVDVAIFLVFGLRWWVLARVHARGLGLLDAMLVRLASFGVSYFTPGPQVGGEPLQVIYLNRHHGASMAHSTAVVALDKLIELLGNYFFLIAGVAAAVSSGLLPLVGPLGIIGFIALALAAWPLGHLLLLRANIHPLSLGIGRAWPRRESRGRLLRYIGVSERLMGRFCRSRPRRLMAVLAMSLIAGGLGVVEYALIMSSFSAVLTPAQTLSAWAAGWLSFLLPVPGGLGALETSQVAVLGHFGVAAELAIGATLLMRARDIVMGGTGMLLTAFRWQSWTSKGRQIDVL